MPNIKLSQPKTLDEALAVLAKEGDQTKIIAGGTALVIMLKNRLISPSILLSLGQLRDLRYIRHEPGSGARRPLGVPQICFALLRRPAVCGDGRRVGN